MKVVCGPMFMSQYWVWAFVTSETLTASARDTQFVLGMVMRRTSVEFNAHLGEVERATLIEPPKADHS